MPITIDINNEEYDSLESKSNTRSTNLRRTRSSSNVRASCTNLPSFSQNHNHDP